MIIHTEFKFFKVFAIGTVLLFLYKGLIWVNCINNFLEINIYTIFFYLLASFLSLVFFTKRMIINFEYVRIYYFCLSFIYDKKIKLKDIDYYFIFGQGPDGNTIGFISKSLGVKIKISRLSKRKLFEIEQFLAKQGVNKLDKNPFWE